ncbi:hypothetical protein AFLA_006952 [Aspergillus flavus NRRL3357]|nr:hypothetical protein AFLA_006952 [Aspergillus flavus NRRL3357]
MMKDTLSFARLALLLFGFVVIPTQAIVGGIATTNSISIDCVLGHSPRDISIKWGASNRLNEPSSSPPTALPRDTGQGVFYPNWGCFDVIRLGPYRP